MVITLQAQKGATLAQLVERLICNQQVGGSSPSGGTGGCRSGQTGRTVNPLARAYGGSNPSPPTRV